MFEYETRAISLCTAIILPVAVAQFIAPPTDLKSLGGYGGHTVRYKEVPASVCESTEGVKSVAGYIDVDDDQHLFFWFFEARNQDPSTAPLTLWLNGGPGDPSTVGLFSENGPCWIDAQGHVQNNEYSWNNVSNMLYLDQPVGTGLSYSKASDAYTSENGYIINLPDATCPDYAPQNSCGTLSSANASLTANSTPAAAPNVWKALQGFVCAFPEYAQNGLYMSTESYGGHYGPVFAEYILEQNAKNVSGTTRIDLRGLSIGNGWFDPIIQFQAYYNFTVSPGNTYGFRPFNETQVAQMYNALYGPGNCLDQLRDCNNGGSDGICSAADNLCYDGVEYLFDTVTGRDEYDVRELTPDPFPYTHWVAYLNSQVVQKAVGAYTNFSYSVTNLGGGTVSTAFGTTGDDSRNFNIIEKIKKLVEQGLYVVHYAGDADYNCNWLGGERVADLINAPGFSIAGYENLTTADGEVHGVVKQSGNYAFARIYDSGHQVPFYKPKAALTMFQRMLEATDIASGAERLIAANGERYQSVGPARSTYQNDNSTIQMAVVGESCTWDPTTNVPVCEDNMTSSS